MSVREITSTCTACDGAIAWIECPTGGWWAHENHPADHHDAVSAVRVIEEMDDHGHWVTTGIDHETPGMPGTVGASRIYRFDLTVEGLMYRHFRDDGFDRYDAAVADYYARRVPDPDEARWRTDYSRAQLRWEKYEDRRGYSTADPLLAQAQAIEQRWITDPQVAPRWAELDDLHAQFDYSTAYPPPEEMSMPGEAPPGMDPVTWRSQLQARDMTGHGLWPDTTTTTTNREGAEPVNDTTRENPHDAESWTEQQMRADFMQARACYPDNPEDYDPANRLDYGEYASRWVNDEQWCDEWLFLETATVGTDKERAAALDTPAADAIRARSQEQARYIAEHGIERDEYGAANSPYNTRVEHRAQTGGSALADHRPGNAIAARLANPEREGVER